MKTGFRRAWTVVRGAAALLFVVGLLAVDAPANAQAAEACIQRDECCKVCNKGKACGNTCISRAKNCHKGRGCACDAEDICE